jgi:hypothetical protein
MWAPHNARFAEAEAFRARRSLQRETDRLPFLEILRLALAVKLISRSQSKGGDGGDCGPSRGDPVGAVITPLRNIPA